MPPQAPAPAAFAARMQDLVRVTREKLTRAKEVMARYANRHRREVEFAVGDEVLLDTRNLCMTGCRKLRQRWVGPFVVERLVGPVACKLHLNATLKGVHDVFHISLLRKYERGGNGQEPPAPIVVDGHEEYEVAGIKGHRVHRGKREFLVSWVGHDASEDTWLAESDLEHAADLLRAYKLKHKLAAGLGLPPCA